MRNSNIRSALVQGYLAAGLAHPTAYENTKFDQPTDTPWCSVFILPNQPRVASLGIGGTDEHTGIMQVDVNYPTESGMQDILADVDAVADYFTAGRRLVYNAQEVIVRSCGRSPGRKVDGWYRISLTIDWYAQTPRS
ncbi:hypothetical protein 19_00017 [Pseudomonas phage Epa19]|nr:hypothetical protein 19_00017 [Pseudomonas phage Epa19]